MRRSFTRTWPALGFDKTVLSVSLRNDVNVLFNSRLKAGSKPAGTEASNSAAVSAWRRFTNALLKADPLVHGASHSQNGDGEKVYTPLVRRRFLAWYS
jgi:hypothetical protein